MALPQLISPFNSSVSWSPVTRLRQLMEHGASMEAIQEQQAAAARWQQRQVALRIARCYVEALELYEQIGDPPGKPKRLRRPRSTRRARRARAPAPSDGPAESPEISARRLPVSSTFSPRRAGGAPLSVEVVTLQVADAARYVATAPDLATATARLAALRREAEARLDARQADRWLDEVRACAARLWSEVRS